MSCRSRLGLRLSSLIRRVSGMTMTLPPHSAAPPSPDPRGWAAGDKHHGGPDGVSPPTAQFELDGSVMHWRIPPGLVPPPCRP